MTTTTNIEDLKVKISLSNTKECKWDTRYPHNHYKVRISKGGKSHTIDFFGSINDYNTNVHPTALVVLNCFASDAYTGRSSYIDFLDELGYDTNAESRKIWNACVKSANAVERLGISEETLENWMDY